MPASMDPDPINQPPPKILSNKPRDSRTMHVEYSLPGLKRAVVAVPFDRWQAGGHAPVGAALAQMMAELDLQRIPQPDTLPGERD